MKKTEYSLERLLLISALSGTAIIAVLLCLLFKAHNINSVLTTVIVLFAVLLCWYICHWIQLKVTGPMKSIAAQIEAIRIEDYSIQARSNFAHGCVYELHNELNTLGDDLQAHKERYDQHVLMIYRLIENIDTPILIFNQQAQLIHANPAFSMIYSSPWQTNRNWQAKRLGLEQGEHNWQFIDEKQQKRWQIRSAQLADRNSNYQMLIFTDIQQPLRQTQQQSWQQVVRVLSHEIRNSLSPIISLAQTLEGLSEMPQRAKKATGVIIERGQHLQKFVKNYSQINQPLHVQKCHFKAQQVIDNLQALFAEQEIQITGPSLSVYADPTLLEQVLINLVKNAIEASDSHKPIRLSFKQNSYKQEIKVIDSGQGIENPDNLFVPFYSTKPTGQGIGLGLSQHIIEQHDGQLTLTNREDEQGAIACIEMPMA